MNYVNFYSLRPGDVIIVPKSELNVILHYALYLGYDIQGKHWIIHNNIQTGVELVTVGDFFNQCHAITRINRFQGSSKERRALVERSLKLVGQRYDMIVYNCEHFINHVKFGQPTSKQVVLFCLLFLTTLFGLLWINKIRGTGLNRN